MRFNTGIFLIKFLHVLLNQVLARILAATHFWALASLTISYFVYEQFLLQTKKDPQSPCKASASSLI